MTGSAETRPPLPPFSHHTAVMAAATFSAASPNTTGSPDADGFVEEVVASWVGFANGPNVKPGTCD